MRTITVRVLVSDIEDSKYSDIRNCALARALRRAGISFPIVGGSEINAEYTDYCNIPLPEEIAFKIANGYRNKSNLIEDFSFDIEVPDMWLI